MICSISVDLDGIRHYCRIYGLDPPAVADPVYCRALPRFLDLFTELGLGATFFVVGEDLEAPLNARLARQASLAGFELGNHSFSHPYDLVRLPQEEQAGEIDQAAELIRAVSGKAPKGFRAPGYTVDRPLLALLAERGYSYDSSVLPSPPYYLAKVAALGWLKLRARASASILGDPRVMWAPCQPYFCSAEAVRPSRPLLELPISVLPGLRLPLIGQSLFLLGPGLFRAMLPVLLRNRVHLNIELHGVDALGLVEDGLPTGLRVQPDLRLGLATKLRILREVLLMLKERCRFLSLADAAAAQNPPSVDSPDSQK